MWILREWDTMAAVVSHLGHNMSTDVVGVVTCVLLGKLASKHTPSDHGGRLLSRRLGSLHAESVASSCPPIWNIMAAAVAAAAYVLVPKLE